MDHRTRKRRIIINKITRNFSEYLSEQLQNPKDAASYVNAFLEKDDTSLMVALCQVFEAHGLGKIAKKTGLNPRISSLLKILKEVGLSLHVEVRKDTKFKKRRHERNEVLSRGHELKICEGTKRKEKEPGKNKP